MYLSSGVDPRDITGLTRLDHRRQRRLHLPSPVDTTAGESIEGFDAGPPSSGRLDAATFSCNNDVRCKCWLPEKDRKGSKTVAGGEIARAKRRAIVLYE